MFTCAIWLSFFATARAVLLYKCCGFNEFLTNQKCQALPTPKSDPMWWWIPMKASILVNGTTNEKMGQSQKEQVRQWLAEPGAIEPSNITDFHEYSVFNRALGVRGYRFEIIVGPGEDFYARINVHEDHEATKSLQDENFKIPMSKFCIDKDVNQKAMVVAFPANRAFVKKCCPFKEMYKRGNCVPVFPEVNVIDDWRPNGSGLAQLDFSVRERHNYCHLEGQRYQPYFTPNISYYCRGFGSNMFHFYENGSASVDGELWGPGKYCADVTVESDDVTIIRHNMIRCLDKGEGLPQSVAVRNKVYAILFLIGGVFLLFSVSVSLFVPEQRKTLPNKVAITHNTVLMVVHFAWGYNLLLDTNTKDNRNCSVRVLIIQYTFLSSLFWLNVFCINMSSAFRTTFNIVSRSSSSDRRRYFVYSLYAWGIPALITLFTILMEIAEEPRFDRPGLTCFCDFAPSQYGNSQFIYLYGPMTILLMMNCVLFGFTVKKIMGRQNEGRKMLQRKDSMATGGVSVQTDRERLYLYTKLFLVMGVSWLFVIINWAVNANVTFSLIVNLLNILRPVFIFIIFTCKKSVYLQFKRQLMVTLGRDRDDGSGRSTVTDGISLGGMSSRKASTVIMGSDCGSRKVSIQDDSIIMARKKSQDRTSGLTIATGGCALKIIEESTDGKASTSE